MTLLEGGVHVPDPVSLRLVLMGQDLKLSAMLQCHACHHGTFTVTLLLLTRSYKYLH